MVDNSKVYLGNDNDMYTRNVDKIMQENKETNFINDFMFSMRLTLV